MADEDASGVRRVHYFNGQLLDAGDFTAEQDYHKDMRRRLNRVMHGTGVAGDVGLRVRKEGDRKLRIGAGVAIDGKGQEIVLVADRVIDLDTVKAKAGTTVFLTLAYGQVDELEVRDAGTASAVNHRRTAEVPRVDFVDKKPADGGDALEITLAAITIDAGGNIAENLGVTGNHKVGGRIDAGANVEVGANLGVAGNAVLRGNVTLAGNLGVAGDHRVGGKLDVGANVEVGANLGVAGNAELRGNVLARTLTVAAGANIVSGLQVQGACDLRSNASVGVDLKVAGSLNVAGEARAGRVSMGSTGLAVGAMNEQLRIVRGIVLSDASSQDQSPGAIAPDSAFAIPNSSVGWRVVKGLDRQTNTNTLTGIYDFFFQPPFTGIPSVSLTPILTSPRRKLSTMNDFGGSNAGSGPPRALMCLGIDNERMRVRSFDPATNASVDMSFSFIVIGPQ
jgi:hypothetical protein